METRRKQKQLSPWKSNLKPQNKKPDPFPGVVSLNGKWGYPYVAPFIIMFVIFGMAPVIYSVYIAFYRWDPLGASEFVGFNNFTLLFHDSDLWLSIRNTFSIWALSTFPQLIPRGLLVFFPTIPSTSLPLKP